MSDKFISELRTDLYLLCIVAGFYDSHYCIFNTLYNSDFAAGLTSIGGLFDRDRELEDEDGSDSTTMSS